MTEPGCSLGNEAKKVVLSANLRMKRRRLTGKQAVIAEMEARWEAKRRQDFISNIIERLSKGVQAKNSSLVSKALRLIADYDKSLIKPGEPKKKRAWSATSSVLFRAVTDHRPGVLKVLLKSGFNPNVRNLKLDSPLHEAAQHGRVELTRLLLEAGAKPDVKNDSGRTPLHCAADAGNHKVVALLLEAEADPNASNRGNITPLYTAVSSYTFGLGRQKGCLECAKLLVEAGADPFIKSSHGESPLDLAKTRPHGEEFLKLFSDLVKQRTLKKLKSKGPTL